jgi:hypothetical protein
MSATTKEISMESLKIELKIELLYDPAMSLWLYIPKRIKVSLLYRYLHTYAYQGNHSQLPNYGISLGAHQRMNGAKH